MERLSAMIQNARRVSFFGGAGVSTESGIPDFRSAHGLYAGAQGRSYEEMLSVDFFLRYPDRFWDFYRDVMLYPNARPNAAHMALAAMERAGKLGAVITQNIDGLHQAAGSREVLELHGTIHQNRCLSCGKKVGLPDVLGGRGAMRCQSCGGLVKPEVVLYGEPLDDTVTEAAIAAVRDCDLLIVGGTSLRVYPAAGFLRYRMPRCKLVLINREETPFDGEADWLIRGSLGDALTEAAEGYQQ